MSQKKWGYIGSTSQPVQGANFGGGGKLNGHEPSSDAGKKLLVDPPKQKSSLPACLSVGFDKQKQTDKQVGLSVNLNVCLLV